jgi:hypothetical protein
MLVYIVVLGCKEECTVIIQSIFLAIVADCSMRPKGKFRFPFATCARILPALEPYLFVQSWYSSLEPYNFVKSFPIHESHV